MKPLEELYWLRFLLGIAAAVICTLYSMSVGISTTNFSISTFLNGFSLALIIYLVSYYVFKWRFISRVEKPQKIFTTGIGAYFGSWIVFWVLFYTILATGLA